MTFQGPTITGSEGLPAIAADWYDVALSTAPTDRDAAAKAVLELYAALLPGRTPEVVWRRSPLEAARLVVAEPERLGTPVRDVLRDAPWRTARADVVDWLGMELFSEQWRGTCGRLSALMAGLSARIGEAVEARAADEPERVALRVALTHALHGQHDAAWLPLFDSVHPDHEVGDPRIGAYAAIGLIAEVARHAGWWWPFENAVVLSDRQTALHLDDDGRLHHAPGPALAYADGVASYAWHGFALEPEFAAGLDRLTIRSFHAEQNVELRRVMLEYFTVGRFIAESGAKPVHEDETGKLWRVEFPDDEPVVMVEVVNSTPEPDGSYHVFFLRVPPDTATAKAGVAWTFGLTEAGYRPLAQT
jgi:hypothetical protein